MSPLTCRHRNTEEVIIETRQPTELDKNRTTVKYRVVCKDCGRTLREYWQ